MGAIRLLIAETDPVTRTLIRQAASEEGFVMDEAVDGITAIKLFRRNEYPLILLNMSLPELDGRNVLIQIRKLSDVPIFILCDNATDEHCLAGFKLGADDVIRKPFHAPELMARIKVFLRRSGSMQGVPERRVSFKGLYIDTFSHSVYVDEQPVFLTPKEYALLAFLSQNPNRAFPRNILLDEVWGSDFYGSERTVDTHIKSLRNSIKPYDQYLVTVWGYGYKFEA
jgi:DNA-binding response OmpR family regulator